MEEKSEGLQEEERWPRLSLENKVSVADVEEAANIEENQKVSRIKKDLTDDLNQSIEDGSSNLLGELRFSQD